MALAPLAEEKNVVLMGISTSTKEVTRGREWTFRYWPLGQAYISTLMLIAKDLKVRKLGILYQDDAFGKEQQQLMSKEFESVGGSVSSELVKMTDTDFLPKIAQLKGMEAIYIACAGDIQLGVLRQLKESGYRGQILSSGFAYQPTLFSLPEANKIYLTAPIIYNPTYLFAKELGEKFDSRYKKKLDVSAAVGYDLIKLFAGLLEERQVSRPSVRDILLGGFEYSGAVGHVRLKSGEHDLTFPVYPAQVQNGSLKYR